MSGELIIKLAASEPITDADLESALYEICDRVHSSCDSDCPVYALNGFSPVNPNKPFKENRGCDTFRSGSKMLAFIRKHTPRPGTSGE